MIAYADTSFLLSLYTADSHHDEASRLFQRRKSSLPFTPLQRHEVRNALRLQVFRKDLAEGETEAVMRTLDTDIQDGFLSVTALVWAAVFEEAEGLSAAYTESLGIRGMDILHVAAARSIGLKDFLTFDPRQKALAVKAGLKVRP